MSLSGFYKYGESRGMRKKPKKYVAGPEGSSYTDRKPPKPKSKAVYAKVPKESETPLERKTYTQLYNLKRPPVDPKEIKKLADKLILWARKDDSIIIEEFAIEEGISPVHFRRLGEKDDYFNEAYILAKHAVGARRERLTFSENLVRMTYPLYNDAFAEYQKEKASWSKKEEDTAKNITVVVEPFKDKE